MTIAHTATISGDIARALMPATSRESSRVALNAVRFESVSGGRFRAIASNGHVMLIASGTMNALTNYQGSFLVRFTKAIHKNVQWLTIPVPAPDAPEWADGFAHSAATGYNERRKEPVAIVPVQFMQESRFRYPDWQQIVRGHRFAPQPANSADVPDGCVALPDAVNPALFSVFALPHMGMPQLDWVSNAKQGGAIAVRISNRAGSDDGIEWYGLLMPMRSQPENRLREWPEWMLEPMAAPAVALIETAA